MERREDPPGRPPPEPRLRLGRLGRAVGLEGGLRFQPDGPAEAELVLEIEEVEVEGVGRVRLREVRAHAGGLLLFLSGVRRVEQARELVNAVVYAPPGAAAEVDPADFRHGPVGLPVRADGVPLGVGEEVLGVPGHEVLSVLTPEGKRVLLPLTAPYVQVLDDCVEVTDPPAGLLDE